MDTHANEANSLTGTRRGIPASDPVPNVIVSGSSHHYPGGNNMKFNRKLRMSSWNVGSLTGRTTELVNIMKKRRIDIMAVQKTKWKGVKSKQLTDGYKLLYNGINTKQNGIGFILAPHLARKLITVERVNDRMMLIKIAFEKLGAWNFITASRLPFI